MRFKRVQLLNGDVSVAVWYGEQWVPLGPALAHAGAQGRDIEPVAENLIACLAGGPSLWEQITSLLDDLAPQQRSFADQISGGELLPFQPRSFRDFMLWERHVIEATRGIVRKFLPDMYATLTAHEQQTGEIHPQLKPKQIWYDKPIYYMGNHLSFLPDGATIPWPPYSRALDYELELGVIIVRPLLNPTPEEALEAIGGFAVVNDWSARDVQVPEMLQGPFGPVKAKHFANSLSAEVVTPDEVLPHLDSLSAQVRVNGELWGEGSTAGMQHSLGAMVAYAALGEPIVPGELLATGTIPGCCGVEVDRWLSPGDEVELELERVGMLRNRVGAPR